MSLKEQLDAYYQDIHGVILTRQHPVTGLLPASTAVNEHGDYRDAWVRDNVYSIMAVWGLALAYRKLDDDGGRGFELEHAVVKLMRGLLFAMMRQSHKVEAFKQTLNPLDALHAKYDTGSADTVVADDEWGHLQLDATSLFLLMLAQMTASGLKIIFTLDEVNFVQNLVYYIGRAYRTPDYGIWERGDKTNDGEPELNASSVGMAKAALEALNGFNLFGMYGAQASVVHVLPDDIARARITLNTLLPRESSSKETDAALLSAISFPAFAVDDAALVQRTRDTLLDKLGGNYGLKRFLRDGHQTVIEDPHRLHYEAAEMWQFANIESEWPLFYTYLVLDGLFRDDQAQTRSYLKRLDALKQDGLIPELYYVPQDVLEAEKAAPGSQKRLPNDNVPLVWAQSLYYLGQLVWDGLLSVHDIDPLGRHRQRNATEPRVQIVLMAEDAKLQADLSSLGVAAQTPKDILPVRLSSVADLTEAYHHIGENAALGLTGRPLNRLSSLSTSRIYTVAGETFICPPAFLDTEAFYLSLDPEYLLERLQSELAYIHRHWFFLGRPTVTLPLSHDLLASSQDAVLKLLYELKSGYCKGVPVQVAELQFVMQRAATERIDAINKDVFSSSTPEARARKRVPYLTFNTEQTLPLSQDAELSLELENNPQHLLQRLTESANLYEQTEILEALVRLSVLDEHVRLKSQDVSLRTLLEEVYAAAARERRWAIIRRAAGLLGKVDVALSASVTDILVNQKSILIGKAYTERSLITRPLPEDELLAKIRSFCREDVRDRVLTQEVLVYLGSLVRAEPRLFRGLLSVRVGYLILLLASDLAAELGATQDEGYACLMHLPPNEIQSRLREVLSRYDEKRDKLLGQESLSGPRQNLSWRGDSSKKSSEPDGGWWRYRQREGVLSRVPKDFYRHIWLLMEHARGIIIGDKLERRNRLESRLILSQMTPGEKNFALRIEHLLNKIASPEYRQLTIEALEALFELSEQNPELELDDYLVFDVIIGHAVRLSYLDKFPEAQNDYEARKAQAWAEFYSLSPQEARAQLVSAFEYLLREGEAVA